MSNNLTSNQSFSLLPQQQTSTFKETNSIIANFAFLLLVLFCFVVLLQLSASLFSYLFSKTTNPKLITGMVDATQTLIFTQDPSNNSSVAIPRSNNAETGIEFTWSVWTYINNLQYKEGLYRNIFYKGNDGLQTNGLNFPNNSPGLYIAPHTNTLIIMMNTFEEINHEIEIPNIPLNKWTHIIIRCSNQTLDVFVNGIIIRSIALMGVPKQNNGNVYVAANGGFDGNISNLWYYSYALGTTAIQSLFSAGPNTKNSSGTSQGSNLKIIDYLSLQWYF